MSLEYEGYIQLFKKGLEFYKNNIQIYDTMHHKLRSRIEKRKNKLMKNKRLGTLTSFKVDTDLSGIAIKMKGNQVSIDGALPQRVVYRNTFMDRSKRKIQEIPIDLLRYSELALKEFASMTRSYERWFSDKEAKISVEKTMTLEDLLSYPVPVTTVEIPKDHQEETVQALEEW